MEDSYIEVADKLYRLVSPNSKMCTPNSAYITTEKWYKEWLHTKTNLSLFDWCVKTKNEN